MEQLDHKEIDVLLKVLANPADVKYAYQADVQALVDAFPQSGIFRALLAATGDQQSINHAATYFNPSALYKIVNAPESLRDVEASQLALVEEPVFIEPEYKASAPEYVEAIIETEHLLTEIAVDEQEGATITETEDQYDPFAEVITQDVPGTVPEDHLLTETTSDEDENHVAVHEEVELTPEVVSDNNTQQAEAIQEPVKETEPIHYPAAEVADIQQDLAAIEVEPSAEPVVAEQQPEPVQNFNERTEYFHQDIDDEIYDEIVSIEDINLEQLLAYQQEFSNNANHFVLEQDPAQQLEPIKEPEPAAESVQHPDVQPQVIAEVPPVNIVPAARPVSEPVNEKQDLSKYNDEKLPYTFMWWLDKTRREHAAAYQPYVYNSGFQPPIPVTTSAPPVKKSTADELQQQYVENIFNVSIVDDLERKPPVDASRHADRKEDKIIKRFIQAEPQIKHPGNIKLDNENKAKKSSEDADEFVTETLARIYTEQMLYQKAILTYKKLMLKFPEKSLYFASQIELLEKKPN